ncbi:hypothetical protein AAZV13_01G036400 [Glycine max]
MLSICICKYKWWLEKLANISLRQSAAYEVWNFSFNILYHSTQVIAVLFGGMSILAGHITLFFVYAVRDNIIDPVKDKAFHFFTAHY